ncbi:crotonase [Streptomyces sp. RLB3-17]|uniref:enoyl-CoA hydratase-related protein n=1 Tax=unclassified Streptomyces TaxID=2593676 RepID=UPI001164F236|nr:MULTISPECIES: enoyl-CoA hydratase-related protein [unclassified Streptomyces]QDO03903.1 crotonase [Streptomyces sp. RLB1-9]QDO25634.1 crotonase [Streptomyces sp. S1A1-8]QDO35751.1 crotonase [Streptomyces sp. S1A1-3]QDO45772.1 crotonase [Streptomyces sp. RLB3-17]
MTDEVRFEIKDFVAYVTIDRPAVLNAVDGPTTDRLNGIWAEIEASSEVRCVVVTGAGDRAFCVGADMSQKAIDKTGLEYWSQLDPNGFGGLSLRTTLDVPVIARANGYAVGGGMEMVLGCDIVIAADTAKFGLTEPRVGRLPLDGGMVLLQRKIAHNAAMGLLLTGKRVPASELYRLGLVNEVVPATELDDAVQRWVDDVLACSPSSVRAIKQLATRTAQLSAREARDARLPAVMAALDSEDSKEGVLAFQEKRAPVWTGR